MYMALKGYLDAAGVKNTLQLSVSQELADGKKQTYEQKTYFRAT